jgi:hypothetical protein
MTNEAWLKIMAPHATDRQIIDFDKRVNRTTLKNRYRARIKAFIDIMQVLQTSAKHTKN